MVAHTTDSVPSVNAKALGEEKRDAARSNEPRKGCRLQSKILNPRRSGGKPTRWKEHTEGKGKFRNSRSAGKSEETRAEKNVRFNVGGKGHSME